MSDKEYGRGFEEDERAEKELRDLMKKVAEAIMEDESGVSIMNPERLAEFETCSRILRKVLCGKNIKMSAVPHDNLPSVGTISFEAKKFSVTDTDLFARACALASNYEMYPKLDGTIVINLTFYDMTRKVRG